MSELGITCTVLATQLSEAMQKDEQPGKIIDIAYGVYGEHTSAWLKSVADELVSRSEEVRLLRKAATDASWQRDSEMGLVK